MRLPRPCRRHCPIRRPRRSRWLPASSTCRRRCPAVARQSARRVRPSRCTTTGRFAPSARETPLPDGGQARRKEAAPAQGEREADLEAVQGMIKRLASEVSLGGDAPRGGERPNQENVDARLGRCAAFDRRHHARRCDKSRSGRGASRWRARRRCRLRLRRGMRAFRRLPRRSPPAAWKFVWSRSSGSPTTSCITTR